MKLNYYADSETYEGYDVENKVYVVKWEWNPEEATTEYDMEDDDDECAFHLSYDPVREQLVYHLSGQEMYNDGESIETVKIDMHTLLRFLYTIPDGGL